MNVPQLISELLSERKRLDEEILALERGSPSGPKKRVTEIGESRLYQTKRQRDVPPPAKLPVTGDLPESRQ